MTVTPGPWVCRQPSENVVIIRSIVTNEEVCRTVGRYPDRLPGDDGQLIAAAPQLRDALREMVYTYWRGSEDSPDVDAPQCVRLALDAYFLATGRHL